MKNSVNHLITFFTVFLLLAGNSYLSAQDRTGPFIVYKAGTGLSYGLNYHVCESQDGYLWIGTGNGLVKFDGRYFQRIVTGTGNITDNIVVDVAESADGNIWIGGFSSGISRFDPKSQTFRCYPRIGRSGSDLQQVNKILPLANGQVWLGTGHMGLALYEQKTDSFRFFTPEPLTDLKGNLINHFSVRDIVQDPIEPSLLWLVSDGDIYNFNTIAFTFQKVSIKNKKAFPRLFFTCIDHDRKGGLWLGAWGYGMNHFNIRTQQLEHLWRTDDKEKIMSGALALDVEMVDDSTVLWACSLTGLFSYDLQTGILHNITPVLQDENRSTSSLDFQAISKTRNGGVYVGVSGHLLQMHPRFNRLSKKIILSPRSSPEKIIVSQLLTSEDETSYYLSCAGPVSLIKIHSSNLSQEAIKVLHPSNVSGLRDMKWISKDKILALGYDGILYTLQHGEKLMKPLSSGWPSNRRIKSIELDDKGYLWILASKTLFRLVPGTMAMVDSFSAFDSFNSVKYKDWPLHLYHLATDLQGRAWVSSNQGFWLADPEKHTVQRINPETPNGFWMRHDLIKSFIIDRENRLWVGYNGEGLQVFDCNTFLPSDSINPLSIPSQQINDMVITPRGKFLASTTEGLLEIDRNNFDWQLYGLQDGLSGQNLDEGLFVSTNGEIIVPVNGKFNIFNENVLDIYHDNLKINITGLRINDVEQNLANFRTNNSSLKLTHRENNLSLSFAALHWQFPWRTKYSYRFFSENDTSRWISLNEPSLQLSALKPGNYTLQLGAIGTGNTLSWPKNIFITIKPPFWLEYWFIFLINVLVFLLIYGLYNFRLKQLKKPLEIRNTISKNLHDDIGSSFSNIQILTELALRNVRDPEKTKNLLEKSGVDMQRISESLSDIVWNVNPKYDDLNNLFIRMKRYAADSFDGKQIQYALIFPDAVANQKMKMEKRRDFYLIFKEAVHNLVKYARASYAEVTVEIKDQHVSLCVKDNGIGFDLNNFIPGNGLENMQQRALQSGGILTVQSKKGEGTSVTLRIPLS